MDNYFDNLDIADNISKEGEINADLAVKKEPKSEGHLTIDVFQTDDSVIVQSAIAGADPKNDIDISVTKDMVTIRGKREPENKVKPSDYDHREIYWGPFSRAVILPVDVDADKAKATFKNGVLTITLPKLETVHHRKLKVDY